MTRSMYLSRSRSEATTSRVVRSCMAALGTSVEASASDITLEIAMNDSVDSFPPVEFSHRTAGLSKREEPLRIAAFPDFIANDAILAMTSGRASKITSRTPMGQLTRSRSRLSSRHVFNETLPTESYEVSGDVHHSRFQTTLKLNWHDSLCEVIEHEPQVGARPWCRTPM